MQTKKSFPIITFVTVLILASLACQFLAPPNGQTSVPTKIVGTPTPIPTSGPTLVAPPITANEPFQINGNFKWTSEIGGEFSDNVLIAERQVVLADLHGFVTRDKHWVASVNSEVLGHVTYDPKAGSGSYQLFLPEIPQGTLNDVDNNNQQNPGVQIFAVAYSPNISGDPFMTGDDRLMGWPGDQASIKTDHDKEGEVTGGKLIVYAPDDKELFPTAFGADGKLFTTDDPTAAIPAGYSIVDLDTKPFTITQTPQADVTLYEAPDSGPKDYSNDSYTQAFDNLVKFLRVNYAFNGIQGKEPNWDQLVTDIRPRVQQAEQNKDALAFYEALRDFTYAFKDGHVGINGKDFASTDFQTNYVGSLGFTVRVLDNKEVLVDAVLSGSSAESEGMKVGAVINQFNGKPVMDVIQNEPLFLGNQSSDTAILYYKAVMLPRTKRDGQATVMFTNPGEAAKTATLKANPEVDSLLKQLGEGQSSPLLPVELSTLNEGGSNIGYIKINSNLDDLNLIVRLFERGLKEFQDQKVAGIIIDLRKNGGGVNLGLAGFLTQQEIPLGQLQYYNSAQGKFANLGEADKIIANENQYHFDKIATLVGLSCASACELEAYGFSQVPGAVVVGEYPTGGIEAEVSKGQIKMPEGIDMQFPTGREVLPDGSLFLEGTGVQPTVKVPINATTVLSKDDPVLQAGINAILGK